MEAQENFRKHMASMGQINRHWPKINAISCIAKSLAPDE